ncbi:MAG: ROK family protein, partial [Christensenellales bacterium]
IVKDIYDLCVSVTEAAGLKKEDVRAVGMGSPGTVNSAKGIISFAGNLNFRNVNIVKEFRKHWDIKTAVNNDANCAALGEARFGGEKFEKDAIFITLGTGIGTGFIIDGKIFEGNRGEGAEGGHICIKMGGEKCTCGERGCWEAYASATALLRQTERAMAKYPDSLMNKLAAEKGGVDGTVPFEAYKAGDKAAEKVVKTYVKYVATGLVTLINIFRPKLIAIGGGVSNAGDWFIKMIERATKKHVFGGKVNKMPKIVKASLGNDAGIVGAAAPVMD